MLGSVTTMAPFQLPRASTAASRTMGSSPVGSSSAVGFPKELTLQGLRRRERLTRRRRVFFLVVLALVLELEEEEATDVPEPAVDFPPSPAGGVAGIGKWAAKIQKTATARMAILLRNVLSKPPKHRFFELGSLPNLALAGAHPTSLFLKPFPSLGGARRVAPLTSKDTNGPVKIPGR